MIVITSEPLSTVLRTYRSCTVADRQTSPYAMPWEQRFIYLCRDRRQPFATSWAAAKYYF